MLTGCVEEEVEATRAVDFVESHIAIASGAIYPNLIVEVDYATDVPPFASALEHSRDALLRVTDKRAVTFVEPRAFEPTNSDGIWTVEELLVLREALIDTTDGPSVPAGEAGVLHIIYLDGESKEGHWGVALFSTVFVFAGAVRDASTPSTMARAEAYEREILLHEVGHVLGLVNAGVPMQRQHDDGTSHSTNPESIMSSGWKQVGLPDVLAADLVHSRWFDADDLADLRAFQEDMRAGSMAR